MTLNPFTDLTALRAEMEEAEARFAEIERQLDDPDYDPPLSPAYLASDEPVYWLVTLPIDGAGTLYRLVRTRPQAVQALRDGLIAQYLDPAEDEFLEEDEAEDAHMNRAMLARATVNEMRIWLRENGHYEGIGYVRLQVNMNNWIVDS